MPNDSPHTPRLSLSAFWAEHVHLHSRSPGKGRPGFLFVRKMAGDHSSRFSRNLFVANWSQWWGLNPRPTVYETVALPLSYTGAQAWLRYRRRIERGKLFSGSGR